MARLFSKRPDSPEGKYLIQRRDGTIPPWPSFVLAASDPSSIPALLAYADSAEQQGLDPQYVDDIRAMASEWIAWRAEHGEGDPDAPRHRTDDPQIVARMREARSA